MINGALQKLKYLENEKSFKGEIKGFLKGFQVSKIVSELKCTFKWLMFLFYSIHQKEYLFHVK